MKRATEKPIVTNAWLAMFVVTALGVFALKVWLAHSTRGAPDISAWQDFLTNIQQCGVCVYHTGGLMQEADQSRITPFNHPPFMIHALRGLGYISQILHAEFALVLRALTSLVDLGSTVLVYKLLHRYSLFTNARFLLYLLAPATIIVSGFHGQTDTVMIFLVLLSAFLIDRPDHSAAFFGLALSVKIVPLIFLAAFACWLGRRGFRFVVIACGMMLFLSLPFILQEPVTIAREVLGYGSFPGRWGWTRALFAMLGPSDVFWAVSRIGAYLLIGYIYYLSFKMACYGVRLYVALGVVAFLLLSLTPSWGTNYMGWLDPFAIAMGVWPALAYYIASGALLSYLYFVNDDESTRLLSLCWLAVLIVAWFFIRQMKVEFRETKS